MSWWIKHSFPLIMNWFWQIHKMRRTCRNFVISWNWSRIPICLSYYEHQWVVHMICWGIWSCFLSFGWIATIVLKLWIIDGFVEWCPYGVITYEMSYNHVLIRVEWNKGELMLVYRIINVDFPWKCRLLLIMLMMLNLMMVFYVVVFVDEL